MAANGPRIARVYETVLYGPSVPELVAFYTSILGLRLLEDHGEHAAALRVDDGGMLLLFNPIRASGHGAIGPGHVAFAVGPGELDRWAGELRDRGVAIFFEHTWNKGDRDIGRSIYFRDPAGNNLELVEGEAWLP